MNTISIIAIIASFLVVYYFYLRWLNRIMSQIIIDPVNAKSTIYVPQNKISLPITKMGLGWTMSFWIYIDDWTYNYDSNKYIITWNNCNIWLSKKTNDLNVSVPIYNSEQDQKIVFKEVPLQKWLHVAVSLQNRVLDLWINGKLYHSKHLKNVPVQNNTPMEVCSDGGFSGHISRFRYYSYPIPRTQLIMSNNIFSIFKAGPFGKKIPVVAQLEALWKKIKGSVHINVSVSASASEESYN